MYFGFETGRIARSIAEGHGYGNPLYVQTGPTAWMTPIYPYLVAAIFKLFGIFSKPSALVILSLNSIFAALTCFPIFNISLRSFGRGTAIAACWIWALYPYFIYVPSGFVWDTCLGALLVALLFLSALKLKEHPASWRQWLGFGVLGGLCALTNASTLTLCPIHGAWAISPLWQISQTSQSSRNLQNHHRWLSAGFLLTVGLAGTLLPWEIRN